MHDQAQNLMLESGYSFVPAKERRVPFVRERKTSAKTDDQDPIRLLSGVVGTRRISGPDGPSLLAFIPFRVSVCVCARSGEKMMNSKSKDAVIRKQVHSVQFGYVRGVEACPYKREGGSGRVRRLLGSFAVRCVSLLTLLYLFPCSFHDKTNQPKMEHLLSGSTRTRRSGSGRSSRSRRP